MTELGPGHKSFGYWSNAFSPAPTASQGDSALGKTHQRTRAITRDTVSVNGNTAWTQPCKAPDYNTNHTLETAISWVEPAMDCQFYQN